MVFNIILVYKKYTFTMKKWKSICKTVIYIEIIFYMLPLSVTFLMGVQTRLLPFIANILETRNIIYVVATGVASIAWWLLALSGLISLWKLYFNYNSYTLKTIPRAVRGGLVMGLFSLILWESSVLPIDAIGYPLLYWVWLPLLFTIKLLLTFKYNIVVPQMTWQEKLQLVLLTDTNIEQKYQ